MKNNAFIFIYFFTLQSLFPMHNTDFSKDVHTLIDIKPYCIKYINNKSIIVGHSTGCSIINIKTNEKKNISNTKCTQVKLFPDNKIAFTQKKSLHIYNMQNGIIENTINIENHEYILEICPSPCENKIFLLINDITASSNNLVPYILKNSMYVKKNAAHTTNTTHFVNIQHHPKKPIVYIQTYDGSNNNGQLLIYNTSNFSKPLQQYNYKGTSPLYILQDKCFFITKSSSNQSFSLLNLDLQKTQEFYLPDIWADVLDICLYPKENIITAVSKATIKKRKYLYNLCFFDTQSGKLIHKIPIDFTSDFDRIFEFSPDGKSVTFGFCNQAKTQQLSTTEIIQVESGNW